MSSWLSCVPSAFAAVSFFESVLFSSTSAALVALTAVRLLLSCLRCCSSVWLVAVAVPNFFLNSTFSALVVVSLS